MLRAVDLNSLRIRLYLFILVPVVSVLMMGVIEFQFGLRSVIMRDSRRQAASQLAVDAQRFDQWLDNRKTAVRFLAEHAVISFDDPQHAAGIVNSVLLLQPEFAAVGVATADGHTIVSRGSADGLSIPYLRALNAAAAEHRDARDSAYVTDLLVDSGGLRHISVVAPRSADDGFSFGVIALASIERFFSAGVAPRGALWLLGRNGAVIAAVGVPDNGVPAANAVADGETTAIYRNADGEWVIGVRRSVQDGHWSLFFELPVQEVVAPVSRYLLILFGVGIVVVVAVTLPLVMLVRSIEQPIARMVEFSVSVTNPQAPIPDEDNTIRRAPTEVLTLFRSFSRMASTIRMNIDYLERMTLTDHLTGLANRRYIAAEGRRLLAYCVRNHVPISFLMVDIDHFKDVNDTHGHDAGDRVLRAIADSLQTTIRESDILARVGGEEFLIVAPRCSQSEAVAFGERIRAVIDRKHVEVEEAILAVTVSIGVYTYSPSKKWNPHDGQSADVDSLIKKADVALYAAKRAGRDRVHLYPYDDDAPDSDA